MIIRDTTSTPSLPIDWAALQRSEGLFPGLAPPFSPFIVPGTIDLSEQLHDLPEDQEGRLRDYIEAHRSDFGPTIDTPLELRQLLQQLNQGEGRAQGLQKVEAPRGRNIQDMSPAEMLQLLIDYFSNGGAQENQQQPPRSVGTLSQGPGARGGGSGGAGAGGPSSAAPVGPATNTGSLKGNTNAEKAFNYFVQKGLTKEQAAGVVGNLMQESGVNPGSNQAGGPGRGIAQWSEGERWDNLVRFAQQQGKDPNDLGVQLDFLWHELETTEAGALSALKGAGSAAQAAVTFEEKFERAGIPNNEARVRYANDALSQFA